MRIGILGGSFDPVHYGHLLLAESCREACELDQVWFLPAATPPHKRQQSAAEPRHRLEMLRLATGGHASFLVSDLELVRGGVSYTVDTLEAVHALAPDAELFLLLGADTLADLPNWREPRRICELARPVVVQRAGSQLDWQPLAELLGPAVFERLQPLTVEMPILGHSSTQIRAAVAAGRSIRFRTPRAVEKYVETNGLYQAATSAASSSGGEPPRLE